MQLNAAGDISYATLTSPDLGDIGSENYFLIPMLQDFRLNENNGEAYLTLTFTGLRNVSVA
jgi:hypothetical protein